MMNARARARAKMGLALLLAGLGLSCQLSSGGSGKRREQSYEGPFAKLAVNSKHTCLLGRDGAIQCFGGDDSREPAMTPTPTGKFVDLASGRRYACALAEDGSISCFGSCAGENCQPPSGSFTGLALHDESGGCAWDEKHTQCWGWGDFLDFIAPSGEALAKPVQKIVFGADWSLIHYADGTILPFRRGRVGMEGVWSDPLLRGFAERGEVVRDIAGAGAAACVIDGDGRAQCVAYYENATPPAAEHVLAIGFSSPVGAKPACVLAGADAEARAGKISCTENMLGSRLTLRGPHVALGVGDDHICGLTEAGQVDCVGNDRFAAITGRRRWP
ncbi:MAG: hypothetical protein KC457_30895 [Myxococcales bacterium]|nr:hypothetical protein [Myxococcales bacterium]